VTRRSSDLPWRRPRHELLLLALVSAVALSVVAAPGIQDMSRLCLSQAITAGRLTIDGCIQNAGDRSRYGGHLYSDKAPGLSLLELPAEEAMGLPPTYGWAPSWNLPLWLIRVIASGLPFVLCAFLVGRLSEGLAPGFGGAALVTFALGTMIAPLAVSGFDHVPAACFAFGAFALLWSRRPFLAGLAAGAALVTEYEAAVVVLVLGAYAAYLGVRPCARYVVGALPGVAVLGAYDWAAFGAPWHDALHYADNSFGAELRAHPFGLGRPTLHAAQLLLIGSKGLLVVSPVLLAAAAGLWLLWRRGLRPEALTCAAVVLAFGIGETSYFLPYGGISPGPRFFTPALPFLALGLGPAFARWRAPVTALASLSVLATTAVTLTWNMTSERTDAYRGSVWGELARTATQGSSSRLVHELTKNLLVWASASRTSAAILVTLAAAFACAIAFAGGRGQAPDRGRYAA
jgi:hypothetical protein